MWIAHVYELWFSLEADDRAAASEAGVQARLTGEHVAAKVNRDQDRAGSVQPTDRVVGDRESPPGHRIGSEYERGLVVDEQVKAGGIGRYPGSLGEAQHRKANRTPRLVGYLSDDLADSDRLARERHDGARIKDDPDRDVFHVRAPAGQAAVRSVRPSCSRTAESSSGVHRSRASRSRRRARCLPSSVTVMFTAASIAAVSVPVSGVWATRAEYPRGGLLDRTTGLNSVAAGVGSEDDDGRVVMALAAPASRVWIV